MTTRTRKTRTTKPEADALTGIIYMNKLQLTVVDANGEEVSLSFPLPDSWGIFSNDTKHDELYEVLMSNLDDNKLNVNVSLDLQHFAVTENADKKDRKLSFIK